LGARAVEPQSKVWDEDEDEDRDPLSITNTVVEFKENDLIAWRHLGRWIWRYELRQVAPNQTVVTESFDARPTPFKWWLRARKAHGYAEKAVAKTLVRLKKYVEKID
jgi:hypothetical protein